jgi:WD40 repeat protein
LLWPVDRILAAAGISSGKPPTPDPVDQNLDYAPLARLAHTGPVTELAFSPSGDLLLSAGPDDTLIIWDVRSRRMMISLQAGLGGVSSAAFSPYGGMLAAGGANGQIRLWSLTGPVASPPPGSSPVPAGGLEVRPIAVLDMKATESMPGDGPNPVTALAFDPAGQLLASGTKGGMIYLWDLESGAIVRTLKPFEALPSGVLPALASTPNSGPASFGVYPITSAAYSPDGNILAVGTTFDLQIWRAGGFR